MDTELYRHTPKQEACPETLDLFAQPRARRDDPETSHEAAESMVETAGDQRERILAELKYRPMTADELDAEIGWRPTTAGRRLSELAEAKLARPTSEKRLTRTGRNAFVWEVS